MTRPTPVTSDAVSGNGFSATVAVPALAIGTATKRYALAIGGPQTSGTTPVSCTFDGTDMGAAIATGTRSSRDVAVFGYAIPDGATGNKDAVMTMNNGASKPGMAVAIYQDVVSISGLVIPGDGASSTAHSQAVTSDATEGLAVALAALFGAGVTVTGASGTTSDANDSPGTQTVEFIMSKPGAGPTTLNWTTNFSDISWRAALSLNGSSGPPPPLPPAPAMVLSQAAGRASYY